MSNVIQIYYNGNIYTMEKSMPRADAMAIKDGKIVAIGSESEVLRFKSFDTNMVDLKGKTVIPGLIDNHIHTLMMGSAMVSVDAGNLSKEEILKKVEAASKDTPEGEWLEGFGWNQDIWDDKSYPKKEELDAVSFGHPVVLRRVCGHAIWANTKALEIAGIDDDTPNPPGGLILKNKEGKVLGVLTDTAMEKVVDVLPTLSVDEIGRRILKVQEVLLSFGYTAASEMGVGAFDIVGKQQEEDTILAHRMLCKEDKQKLRYYLYIFPGETLDKYMKNPPEVGLYNDRLTIRGQKLFGDGTMGADTAWLLDDYLDKPGHKGNGRYTFDELVVHMEAAKKAGFQTAIHAIGDATIRQAIDAYKKINPQNTDIRFRIEHCLLTHEKDISDIGEGGIITSIQFSELSSDLEMAIEKVGIDRLKTAYPWNDILKHNGVLVSGTDSPMETTNPFELMYYGVTRKNKDGQPKGGFYPDNAVTRWEALNTFTLAGAFARFEEEKIGSLKVGKHADFAVIDRDYFTCATDEIKDIKVLSTFIEGEEVYKKHKKGYLDR